MGRMRCILLALAMMPASVTAKSLEEIEACMRANVPQTLQIREFEIQATSGSGEKERMVGRLYARHEDDLFSAMMSLTAPFDLQGAAYLVRESRTAEKEEELYVYLPALNKIRRVTGSMKGSSLFGTDFSYTDLRRVAFAIADDEAKLEREETLGERPTWVMSLMPDAEDGESFDQMLSWVDQESCLVIQADFMVADKAERRFSVAPEHLQKSGVHWYFSQARIENFAHQSHTELFIREVLSNEELTSRLFNPRMFHLGR